MVAYDPVTPTSEAIAASCSLFLVAIDELNVVYPAVAVISICEEAVTQPGYCAELLTVPFGKNAVTWAELLTISAGILDNPVYDI